MDVDEADANMADMADTNQGQTTESNKGAHYRYPEDEPPSLSGPLFRVMWTDALESENHIASLVSLVDMVAREGADGMAWLPKGAEWTLRSWMSWIIAHATK